MLSPAATFLCNCFLGHGRIWILFISHLLTGLLVPVSSLLCTRSKGDFSTDILDSQQLLCHSIPGISGDWLETKMYKDGKQLRTPAPKNLVKILFLWVYQYNFALWLGCEKGNTCFSSWLGHARASRKSNCRHVGQGRRDRALPLLGCTQCRKLGERASVFIQLELLQRCSLSKPIWPIWIWTLPYIKLGHGSKGHDIGYLCVVTSEVWPFLYHSKGEVQVFYLSLMYTIPLSPSKNLPRYRNPSHSPEFRPLIPVFLVPASSQIKN